MSKTEELVVLDTESKASIGDKPNIEKGKKASFGNVTRKKLLDISNLPRQARVSTLDEKSHLMPIATIEYIDQLKKENMTLGKILAERNKIIEVTGIELQKLRVNLQKMQQQNRQLAQSNSQMLADLSSGKDRLKVLQHELGCKNALLTSKKLEMKERLETKKCEKLDAEVELTNCQAAEVTKGSSKVGKDDDECANTRRRPKSKSLGPRQVQSKDEIENKRPCVRRQSARFRPEQVKSPSDLVEAEDAKVCVHFPSTEDGPPRENGSASARISIQDEVREGKHAPKHDTGNKRTFVRRQSARLKSEEPVDLLDMEDSKIAASLPNDGALLEDNLTSTNLFFKNKDNAANPAPGFEALESKRSSLSRPLRQAAKKVQSYKEIPLNIKMRRPE